eukprot:2110368-Rhodomonas_salina.1
MAYLAMASGNGIMTLRKVKSIAKSMALRPLFRTVCTRNRLFAIDFAAPFVPGFPFDFAAR